MYDQRFETKHNGAMDFGPYGLGACINPMQNQLEGLNVGINWGMQNLEVGFMGSRWEGAPLGKLSTLERDEMIRLAKLNKVNLTVHAPLKDLGGFNGKTFDETTRLDAFYDMKQSLLFADNIGNETGVRHIPVVVHSSNGTPGNPNPKEQVYYADRETGAVDMMKERTQTLSKETVSKIIKDEDFVKANFHMTDEVNQVGTLSPIGWLKIQDERARNEMGAQLASVDYNIYIIEDRLKRAKMQGISENDEQVKALYEERNSLEFNREMVKNQMDAMRKKYNRDNPRFVTTDQMAIEKVSDTVAELAQEAYKMKSQPMIAVENIYPEMAIGRIEDLNKTVLESRRKFEVEMAPKIGADAASKAANEIIGATLDIGHLNLWLKYKDPNDPEGKRYYSKQDIEDWAMKAQETAKHIHLTDNFGDEDNHLPIGWGNAPIAEIVKKYKDAGFKGKMILETPGVGEKGHQMMIGIPASFETMNYQLSPSKGWADATAAYFTAGYAFTGFQNFPDINFQTYGLGFSGLPYASGAQLPGAKGEQSKFSGAPMS